MTVSAPFASALVSSQSGDPLHAQLKSVMLQHIGAGHWKPEGRIPSERELGERFGISRTTTRRVIRDLVHEGVLQSVPGKGTFVTLLPVRQPLEALVGFTEDMRRRGVEVVTRVIDFTAVRATDEIAAALGFRPQVPVFHIKRVRFAGSKPIAVQTAWLPEHLCPGLQDHDLATTSLFGLLRLEYGLVIARGATNLGAALANAEERQLLQLSKPAAVLRSRQTTWLADGQIIEFCKSSFVGEGFELTSNS